MLPNEAAQSTAWRVAPQGPCSWWQWQCPAARGPWGAGWGHRVPGERRQHRGLSGCSSPTGVLAVGGATGDGLLMTAFTCVLSPGPLQ